MQVDVLVVGGGVSGLCAAVECAARGHAVMLAEQTPHLGGRAYSFIHKDTHDEVDNGQHLMLGCYHSTLQFLRTVGAIGRLTLQPTLEIYFRSTIGRYHLRAPVLPAPFHAAGALFRLGSLSLYERFSLLRVVHSLLTAVPDNDVNLQAMTVDEWLTAHGQRGATKTKLWNILSVGTLNERPDQASAALFVKVLQTVFLGRRRDASIALPRVGLSRLFADPGADYLHAHGASIALNTRVQNVIIRNGSVVSVRVGGETIEPHAVVSAVPFYGISSLFPDESRSVLPWLGQTRRLSAVPIVSIHLWYDTHFVEEEFTALLESPIDWVFKKYSISGLMHLSLVISAARVQSLQKKETIVRVADEELRRYFPKAAEAVLKHALVLKEHRATFSPRVDSASARGPHATSACNLFIAGDWTDTKLPATIEGAAQSGYACAAMADTYLRTMLQRHE